MTRKELQLLFSSLCLLAAIPMNNAVLVAVVITLCPSTGSGTFGESLANAAEIGLE